MERATIAVVNALNGSGGGLGVARAGCTNGNPPDIGASLYAARRDHRSHQVTRPKASNDTGGFRRLIRETEGIGPAHLPAMAPLSTDEQGNDPTGTQQCWRARSHTGRIHPMGLGQPALG